MVKTNNTAALAAKKTSNVTEYMAGAIKVSLTADTVKKYLVSGDASKVTDQEVMMYIGMCKANGLNPFNRECYLIKYGSSPATQVTAKQAFMNRAEDHPAFDGFEAGIIVFNGESIEKREGSAVFDGEELLGGWAKVYRRDRSRPTYAEVSVREYDKGQSMWKSSPATMIRKVALVHALREAFPRNLGALYTNEELGVNEPGTVTAEFNEAADQYQVFEQPAENAPAAEEDGDPFDRPAQ